MFGPFFVVHLWSASLANDRVVTESLVHVLVALLNALLHNGVQFGVVNILCYRSLYEFFVLIKVVCLVVVFKAAHILVGSVAVFKHACKHLRICILLVNKQVLLQRLPD